MHPVWVILAFVFVGIPMKAYPDPSELTDIEISKYQCSILLHEAAAYAGYMGYPDPQKSAHFTSNLDQSAVNLRKPFMHKLKSSPEAQRDWTNFESRVAETIEENSIAFMRQVIENAKNCLPSSATS